MKTGLQILRAISLLLGVFFLGATIYPAVGMSADQLLKGRLMLGTVSAVCFFIA